jgi:hypothetical protein
MAMDTRFVPGCDLAPDVERVLASGREARYLLLDRRRGHTARLCANGRRISAHSGGLFCWGVSVGALRVVSLRVVDGGP